MEITEVNVERYVSELVEPRRTDILEIMDLFESITNIKPQMWGSIVGYGDLHYKYKTGTEGNMPLIGLANRKQAITLYLSYTISEYPELEKLGKYKVSKSCLYIKKLSDINIDVLTDIIKKSIEETSTYDFITEN